MRPSEIYSSETLLLSLFNMKDVRMHMALHVRYTCILLGKQLERYFEVALMYITS